MSIYKTFKNIYERGFINGKKYELVSFSTWYYPYSYLNGTTDVAECKLAFKRGTLSDTYDQFGNNWYSDGNSDTYIAYADGIALNTEPTDYYDACQLISKDANLPKDEKYNHYDYCYNKLHKVHDRYYNTYDGEYVPDYDSMFKVTHKVGDRVFFVTHYDSDTRNGDRLQVESMIIRYIDVCCGKVIYYNYDPEKENFFSISHTRREQYRCTDDVETLIRAYKGRTLYMWHRNGLCSIEPCTSTSLYLAYNGKDD